MDSLKTVSQYVEANKDKLDRSDRRFIRFKADDDDDVLSINRDGSRHRAVINIDNLADLIGLSIETREDVQNLLHYSNLVIGKDKQALSTNSYLPEKINLEFIELTNRFDYLPEKSLIVKVYNDNLTGGSKSKKQLKRRPTKRRRTRKRKRKPRKRRAGKSSRTR